MPRFKKLRKRSLVGAILRVMLVAIVSDWAHPAGAVDPLASGRLEIQGTRLSLYQDTQTMDAEQTVNAGEAVRIRTCYGSGPCGQSTASGLRVRGDLRGPELSQPVTYETVPGGTFFLPGFQVEGDYFLENIRLEENGRVLGHSSPPIAVIHVRKILLTEARVSRLTLEELRARGISLNQENAQAYRFAIGFAFGGQTVTLEMPVLYQGAGSVEPLEKPRVNLDALPPEVAQSVRRWEPPRIVPFKLDLPPSAQLDVQEQGEEAPAEMPLFGAIVIPGSISFLNQFFEARLIVANGADAGSSVQLANIRAALRLPSGGAVRLARTDPPVGAGTWLPVLGQGGDSTLDSTEQGSAAWTVEGLVTGTHALRMDITADLLRPGHPALELAGSSQAAVEVVDARFNLAFSHPDTVRDGEAYSLFVTVTNLSRAAMNEVNVAFGQISGAHVVGSPSQAISTLPAGGSETLEFRMLSESTGKCFATTFQTGSAGLTGSITLRTGVGELGIPLSPATLVLPRHARRLPPALLSANQRFLGLAYSLAVAPAGAAPQGLPHVIRSDVERRATDLGEAGQRLFLTEPLLESLEVLALDQLGNRHELQELDTLRRKSDKGLAAAAALGTELRTLQASHVPVLDAASLFDHFISTTSYSRPFLAAVLVPSGGRPAPVLEVTKTSSLGFAALAYSAEESGQTRLRDVPYGEIYSVSESGTGGALVPLAMVGRLDRTAAYALRLWANAGVDARGRLIVLAPNHDGVGFARVEFPNLDMRAGDIFEILVVPPSSSAPATFEVRRAGSGLPVAGVQAVVQPVTLPPFRITGAVQDFDLDPYGSAISYLFNRPPAKASAENAALYQIATTSDVEEAAGGGTAVRISTKTGAAAFWQPNSERVVNVRFTGPISPLSGGGGRPLVTHVHTVGAGLADTFGNSLATAAPGPVLDAGHTGGLVEGKVLDGLSNPVAAARVSLLRWRQPVNELGATAGSPVLDLVAQQTTGTDGAFYFDFVEEPAQGRGVLSGFVVRAETGGSSPEREEVSSRIRLQGKLVRLNVAFLGRGTVQGRLVYEDGVPVVNGSVTVANTLFSEMKTVAVTGSDATFTVSGIPVGPVTVTGRDAAGNSGYVTVGLETGGQVKSDVVVRIPHRASPRTGTVTGTVVVLRSGQTSPVARARVALYASGGAFGERLTDASGNFRFERVPEGQVTVQAADFSISRSPVVSDLMLVADQTANLALTLAEAVTRTVSGSVFFHEPATNTDVPVAGAVVFVEGPGNFAYTDSAGTYRIENVPTPGLGESYLVTAIDLGRKLQGSVSLARFGATAPEPIALGRILLRTMTGALEGLVLDPLGRPIASAGVVLGHLAETRTASDGTFVFEGVPVGSHTVTAHSGDGLEPGRLGYFGLTQGVQVVYGGHRARATVQMRGAGIVRVETKSPGGAAGILSPLSVSREAFLDGTKAIGTKTLEAETSPAGFFEIPVPVGSFGVRASHPFHGTKSSGGRIDFPGQIKNVVLTFDSAATVTGRVLAVDGVTPVEGAEVFLSASGLLPQRLLTGPDGAFRYELVPPGSISLSASARIGTITRYGKVDGWVTSPGQTLDVTVVLGAQGTVRGSIKKRTSAGEEPALLPFAEFYVQESSHPNRRFPAGSVWSRATAAGAFDVAGVSSGLATVIARDPGNVTVMARAQVQITADFQIVDVPPLVLFEPSGTLEITVTDPETGSGVPDCQIRLSSGETTVADSLGRATFEALPYGTYSVHVFHAPTGRGGHADGILIDSGHGLVARQITLGGRGRISGILFDNAARTTGVGGATIALAGRTDGQNGPAAFSALATTDGAAATRGGFAFEGIPIGTYTLTAGVAGSSRRADAHAALTPTSTQQTVDLVLEPIGDVHVRLFETLSQNPLSEINPALGLFSVRLLQPAGCSPGTAGPTACAFDYTVLTPSSPAPNHLYVLPSILTSRPLEIQVQEATGERRTGRVLGAALAGSGTSADPYRAVLEPRGTLRVEVKDAGGQPVANAEVRVNGPAYSATFAANGEGRRDITSVPRGTLRVSAVAPGSFSGLGGSATTSIEFDDDIKNVLVNLSPSHSVEGRVHREPANGSYSDPAALPGEPHAAISIQGPVQQAVQADADGRYRFDGLPAGTYAVTATGIDGVSASASVVVPAPEAGIVAAPPLVLDGSRPLLVSIAPPPGATGVSRSATVELVFSEPLHPAVVSSLASYFSVRLPSGTLATGLWSTLVDTVNRQLVRFTPGPAPDLFASNSTYAIQIKGGPDGVRDRAGNLLTDVQDIGSNFTTADTLGPVVIGTLPGLDQPVDPQGTIRFDFNEPVTALPSELDGNLVDDAGELYYGQGTEPAVTWSRIPVELYLTSNGYSLALRPLGGLSLPGDNGRRRVVVTRLKDSSGNAMAAPYIREFGVRDAVSPQLVIGFPSGSLDGRLSAGTAYVLTPAFSPASLNGPPPFGDVARVEYFTASAADPNQPSASPAFVASTAPFTFTFAPSYQGDGTTPRPYSVWVTATDTSLNRSNTVRLTMEVVPNQPPAIGSVTIAPVGAAFYAGSTVRATVSSIADPDGNTLTLAAELRRENPSNPNDPADLLASVAGIGLTKPAGGWQDLPAQTFDLVLPIGTPEGTRVLVRVRATDSLGGAATKDTATAAVADDASLPAVVQFQARAAGQTEPSSQFFLGQNVLFEFRASDAETAVKSVSIGFDGLFASPVTPTLVTGDQYRTAELSIPPEAIPQGGRDVIATATVEDWGGNMKTATLTIHILPTSDPTAPVVEWASPMAGGQWPAGYTSVRGQAGVSLLLRVRVTDSDRDGQGNLISGTVLGVRLWGPGPDGLLTPTPVPAARVAGTDLWEAGFIVPNGIASGRAVQFRAEATDSGQNRTTVLIELAATSDRVVYENVTTSIANADSWSQAATVFLLDGAVVSLPPRGDGQPHAVDRLYLYSGFEQGAVRPAQLTTPEITSVSSPVLYNPLKLEIGTYLGLGSGSVIRARGLMGSTSTATVALPGVPAPETNAGGSHGGLGGTGLKPFSPRTKPGQVYDSVREPSLPGTGGRSALSEVNGGAGGGVVILRSPAGEIRLEGDIDVSGAAPQPDYIVNPGGAGGTVRIAARSLQGAGRIRANGGPAVGNQYQVGAGGGGRISLSFQQPLLSDLGLELAASGGADSTAASEVLIFAGAGTIFLQQLDSQSQPVGNGKLIVDSLAWKPAGLTPLPALWGWRDGQARPATVAEVDLNGTRVRVNALAAAGDWNGERIILSTSASSEEWSGIVTSVEPTADAPPQFWLSLATVTSGALEAIAQRLSQSPPGAVYARVRSRLDSVEVKGNARLVLEDDITIGPDPGFTNDRAAFSTGANASVLLRSDLPTAAFVANPEASIAPPGSISFQYGFNHPVGILRTDTLWSQSGYASSESYREYEAPRTYVWGPVQLPIPATQPPGTVQYKVKLWDLAGRVGESVKEWTVLPENVPPQLSSITLAPTRAGDAYTAGEPVTISVSATDNIAVARVVMTVGSDVREFTAPPFAPVTLVWTAPPVSSPTQFVVTAEAFDQAGNRSSTSRSLTVNPLPNPNPPAVNLCPSTGAHVPSGLGAFQLRASTSDDLGVYKVEFYKGNEPVPFTVRMPSGGGTLASFVTKSEPFALPTVSEATPLDFTVKAYDASGNVATASATLIVVPAAALSASGPNDWPALTSQTVYLSEGVLSLTEDVRFANLILLDGAVITHPQGGDRAVRIDTGSGFVEIQCSAAIDVTGKGFAPGATYPALSPAGPSEGGSHLGIGGGITGTSGRTYGSVVRPREAGAGGGSEGSGGGVVKVTAGNLSLHGEARIAANGTGAFAGGAGGAIWIDAGRINDPSWTGTIEAKGAGTVPAGGGGAIALSYSDPASSVDVTKLSAGGGGSGTGPSNGGAGTVLITGPAATFGTLTVDNGGVSGQPTILPALGSGTSATGTGGRTLATGMASIPSYFPGHWLELEAGGTPAGLWRVESVEPGGMLTLEPAANLDSGLTYQWRGSYRFDQTIVRNGARLESADLLKDAAPTVSVSAPVPGTTVVSGRTVTVLAIPGDDSGLKSLEARLGTTAATVQTPAAGQQATLVLTVPSVAESTPTALEVTAIDLGNQPTVQQVPVTIAPDPVPVVTASAAPSPVDTGQTVTVSYSATDDLALAAIELSVSGVVTVSESRQVSGTSASGTFSIPIPADAVPGDLRIVVFATDTTGGRGSSQPITVAVRRPALVNVTTSAAVHGPGEVIAVTVIARHPGLVRQLRVGVTGAFSYQRLVTVSAAGVAEAEREIGIPVPRGNLSGSASITVTAVPMTGSDLVSSPALVQIVDSQAPVAWSFDIHPDGPVPAGRDLELAVQTVDSGGVASVAFVLVTGGEQELSRVESRAELSRFVAPVTFPAGLPPGAVTIRADVRDHAGNLTSLSRTVPVSPQSAPHVWFHWPSNGAPVLPGGSIQAHVMNAGPGEMTSIDWFIGGVAVAPEVLEAPFNVRLAVPAGLSGPSVTLLARVHSASGVTEVTRELALVSGAVVVDAPRRLEDGDLSLENQIVALKNATLTLRGEHHFQQLILLDGARVTSDPAGAGEPSPVDLHVAGLLYVDPNSVIDVRGLGYRGGLENGNPHPEGRTVGQQPGSAPMAGGSAAGLGGRGSGTPVAGPAYGSIRNPVNAGSGGGASLDGNPGGSGGGLIRVHAGRILNDGGLGADGSDGWGGGGSGGSLLLDAPVIEGRGVVSCRGGAAEPSLSGTGGSGGGGRMALLGATTHRNLWLTTSSSSQAWDDGGAGTIFMKDPREPFGHLVVDNGAATRGAKTPLVSIGSGTISAVEGTAIRGGQTNWKSGVSGNFVDITRGPDFIGRFRVESADEATQTVTLEPEALLQVLPGDAYQGVQVFDSIQVRSRASLETSDRLEGRLAVSADSSVRAANVQQLPPDAPPVVALTPSAVSVFPGSSLIVTLQASDDVGLVSAVWSTMGALETPETALPLSGTTRQEQITIPVPPGTPPGRTAIVARVLDSAGNRTWAALRVFDVLADGAPTVTASAEPLTVTAGQTLIVTYAASDDIALMTVALEASGAVTSSQSRAVSGSTASGTFSIPIPAGTFPGDISITVTATDSRGGVSSAPNLTVPVVGPPLLPGADMAEGSASGWQAFSQDGAPAVVANETTQRVRGQQSLKFTSESQEVAGIRYTVPAGGSWDLSQATVFSFWELAGGEREFTGPQPVVVLRSVTGESFYHPAAPRMSAGSWRRYVVSLSDLGVFARTTDGDPSLSEIREIEIRHRATGPAASYTIYIDGIQFMTELEGDLAEGNAGLWTPFADGGEPVLAGLETSRMRAGASAIRFVTESGGGTGLRFAAGARPNWDLSSIQSLYFYTWAENPSPFGFQGMAVYLRGPAGTYRYTPAQLQLENGAWRLHEVPLGGDAGWIREIADGSPDLSSMDEIEIWFDTWDAGFTVFVDGVTFGQRMPLLSVLPRQVPAGQPAEATVRLDEPAPAGGRVLSITSSDPAVSLTGPLIVPEGEVFATFPVTTGGQAATTVTLTWDDGGRNRTASLDLTNLVLSSGDYPDTVAFPGPVVVEGSIGATRLEAGSLTVKNGSELRPLSTANSGGSSPQPLILIVEGNTVVEEGASIHANGFGYGPGKSHPSAVPSQPGSGGSHIGLGGQNSTGAGTSYGSVTTPLEAGAGNGGMEGFGGGVIYLRTGSLRVDGAITAHGGAPGGAGGSIQIRTGALSGIGEVGALGQDSEAGSGAGGAISIVYSSEADGILERVNARAGGGSVSSHFGGAGTVFLFGPASTYGELIVDNWDVQPAEKTVLPGLGGGLAQAGSGGAIVETGRPEIPFFFVNHWVEVKDPGGVSKGLHRVISTGPGGRLELLAGASVSPGDSWRGIYLFDRVSLRRGGSLESADPLHPDVPVILEWNNLRSPVVTGGPVEIRGGVNIPSLSARSLLLRTDSQLSPPDTAGAGEPAVLYLDIQEGIQLEAWSAINATGLGYRAGSSLPGSTMSEGNAGGSHLGLGGMGGGSAGSAFGSVTQPLEAGGGPGTGDARGGGAVRISAGSLSVADGAGIYADAAPGSGPGGAGGSIWITAGELSGDGGIAARGAESASASGAGGVISVEYTALAEGSALLQRVTAHPGRSAASEFAGGGTILIRQTGQPYGDLLVHGFGITGGRATVLPSLGSGAALAGSGGALLRIARPEPVPPYFLWHWVEIKTSLGAEKGRHRITSVGGDGRDLTLSGDPGIVEGDLWNGLYLFGSVNEEGGATLQSGDPVTIVPLPLGFPLTPSRLTTVPVPSPNPPKGRHSRNRSRSEAN
ncbi:MAG: Ig-like domain-containing protein [Thermoanaerobaculia bacterium]|nr:Ig-like domain-containing protein [Thermoanaerobaculia bacterium]